MSEEHYLPGSVRIPPDKMHWIPLLKRIYEFESERVSGSGSSRRDIQNVLWTLGDFGEGTGLSESEAGETIKLLEFLEGNRQVMRVHNSDGSPDRFITRVAETIRLLGHTYEYWHRGRPGVGAIRWLVEEKKIPNLSISAPEFIDRLVGIVIATLGEGDDTLNLRNAIEIVVKGVAGALSPRDWKLARFSSFQFEATKEMMLSQFQANHDAKTQILTAGVGSGKTIGFVVATLISAVEGIRGGEPTRRSHLLIYPRKALARDQYETVRKYAESIGIPGLQVFFEHASQYSSQGESVKSGLQKTYGKAGPPPDIIVTTFETLKRRLQVPYFVRKMAQSLSRVVLDEVHLAEGLSGAHVAMLMSRLRQLVSPREILWTGSSATVARPDEHAERLFGIRSSDVRVILPAENDLETVGLAHHIFVRSSGRISTLGVLVNATSLLLHNRRADISDRPRDDRRREKSIAFADSLDWLGRWNADLRENERTESTREREHPTTTNRNEWTERQKELPYALRFHKPLQRRIDTVVDDGEGDSNYEPVLTEFRGRNLCGSCVKGERIVIGDVDQTVLHALSKIAYRDSHEPEEEVEPMRLLNPVFSLRNAEIGTLDLCPYLRAGACAWFPHVDEVPIEEIPNTRPKKYEWNAVARSTLYSSKKSKDDEEMAEGLADVVFKDSAYFIYDVGAPDKKIPVDIVLASPSLEVGVDLPMLTECIMIKAIRNVASYRQKAGRIGRERGLDVLNVTLITDTPTDLHYYRQPRKLISRGRLDPIPMKDRNEAVLNSSIYTACWDWLALKADLPELVPSSIEDDGKTEFSRRLQTCRDILERQRTEVHRYLSRISRIAGVPSDTEIDMAIEQILCELDLLLRDASKTLTTAPERPGMTIADAFVYRLAGERGKAVTLKSGELIEPFYTAIDRYKEFRRRISPENLQLDEEFSQMDRMEQTSWWDGEVLKNVSTRLKKRLEDDTVPGGTENLREIAEWIVPGIEIQLRKVCELGHDPVVLSLFEDYNTLLMKSAWEGHYLSTTMKSLRAFASVRKKAWFVRPQTLFSNPYEETVRLVGDAPQDQREVPIGEALFGFLPGTWTFRIPHRWFKTKTGLLQIEPGGSRIADLSVMEQAGNRFIRVQKGLPPPLGLSGSVDVYRPLELSLKREPQKYVPYDRGRGLILDGDEARRGGEAPVKIPRSFASRWVHVESHKSEQVTALPPEVGEIALDGEYTESDESVLQRIRHPLLGEIFERVDWHDDLAVTEYIYAISRSYSGGDGVELIFRSRFGNVAFGTHFRTEGISILLNTTTLTEAIGDTAGKMKSGASEWSPSSLKAFRAHLHETAAKGHTILSPFILDDIIEILLTSMRNRNQPVTLSSLSDTLRNLAGDPDKLEESVTGHLRREQTESTTDVEAYGGQKIDYDEATAEKRSAEVSESIRFLANSLTGEDEFLGIWLRRTVLNTLGIVALTTLQQFSGANDTDVGYAIDDAWMGGAPRLFLYDRAPFGNGNTAVARRYLHILQILRHGENPSSRLLPSEDYFSMLEENLLQCPQFHTDMSALSMFASGDGGAGGMKGLCDVEDQAKEVLYVAKSTWRAMGIRGPEDASSLPIANASRNSLAASLGIESDDLLRATTICWNGCPECVDRPDMVNGGLTGRDYIDRMVLDTWFALGRAKTEEYVNLDLRTLASGKAPLRIGELTRLRLDLRSRRLRSVWLPCTIGFDIERTGSSPKVQMVIRVSDTLNLLLSPIKLSDVATGVEAVGFKRLMWFDLIMTAYLDVLGLLTEHQKTLKLVYYDCRDLSFDDVGLSQRMVEAVLSEARKSGCAQNLERLSDILTWLLRRGFRISMCVDSARAKERAVKEFLNQLAKTGGSNVDIWTKNIDGGSMHKKALVTPIGVLKGSANLTEAGAERNEEIIDHFMYGSKGYHSLCVNIDDTFHGAVRWQTKE